MTDELPVVHPAPSAGVRVNDADRDRAVGFLRHHVADGLLTLDEFSDRVGDVFAATTSTDIERVTSDLPAVISPTTAASTTVNTTRTRKAVRWTVAILGGNQQRGRWRVEGQTNAVAFMGGCELDLRQAEVIGDEVEILALACMGGVDIIVPEGIAVVLTGFSLMGGKQNRVKEVPVIPGSPVIRVRAFSLMGGISVRSRRPAGETSRDQLAPPPRDRDRGRERHGHRHDERHRDRGLDRPPNFGPPPRRRGIEAVAEDVREQWPQLRSQVAPEGTVTIFFSDIEGFTSMNERLGDQRAQQVLREHYAIVRDELMQHRGFEVKVHGDGFMVAFDSAARGLRCAQSIQKRQQAWNEGRTDDAFRVRMGLHTGEAIRDADDFLGSTVNLASRIATAARGGEILVSALLRELCASTGEFSFDDGQELELKGLSQPHRVFSVRWS